MFWLGLWNLKQIVTHGETAGNSRRKPYWEEKNWSGMFEKVIYSKLSGWDKKTLWASKTKRKYIKNLSSFAGNCKFVLLKNLVVKNSPWVTNMENEKKTQI